jgi:hypothetical protein
MIVIKLRQPTQPIVVSVALDLALRQSNRAVEVSDVAIAQQLVLQHRAERGRDRHRQLERHLVPEEPLHHREERDVAFGYRLEEPIFLEKFLMLGVPDKRQMRVKNEREVTGGHDVLKL